MSILSDTLLGMSIAPGPGTPGWIKIPIYVFNTATKLVGVYALVWTVTRAITAATSGVYF